MRKPGYAVLATLTLALGVGGTAATYGIARTVLFAPLPYAHEREVAPGRDPPRRRSPRASNRGRVGHGAFLVAVGIVAGVVGASALTRLLSSLLYGVEAIDPISFAAAAATLLGVGVFAALVPAWRAGMIDPAIALREQ